MLWVAASRESPLKLFDTLVDGLHLPFHPVFFRLEGLQGFFLRGRRVAGIAPARSPSREETMPPTESAAPTAPPAYPRAKGWICESRCFISAAATKTMAGSRTRAHRTCLITSWYSNHLLSLRFLSLSKANSSYQRHGLAHIHDGGPDEGGFVGDSPVRCFVSTRFQRFGMVGKTQAEQVAPAPVVGLMRQLMYLLAGVRFPVPQKSALRSTRV